MSCLEVCYSYFRWCEYFWGRSVSFVTVDEFSVRVTKITSRIVVSWTISLSSVFCFWRKLNNFESQSSLKLSFTNIRGLRSNFVKCESSFNQILLIFLLYVRQTWLSWFWQFLFKRLPSFNLKGFCYSSQFMWRKDFLLHGPTTYRENSPDCYLCFRLALFRSMSYFFFLQRSHSSSFCTIFDAISYNIDEVLLINPSANMFI